MHEPAPSLKGRQVHRGVYRHAQLKRLLDPASIAIIGVSTNGSSFGAATARNLQGFQGRVYLVNPKYSEIGNTLCYPSVAALPEVPDCVVIAVPRDSVEPMVRACADAGVGGAIIFASGFAETGKPELAELQQRIVAIADAAGMRLVGPNSIGVSNYLRQAPITFFGMPAGAVLDEAAVGLVSQSGALGNALTQAMECGVSFSHLLSSGNSCDVDVADYISYLADDPGCKAIACLFEGMAEPRRMLEAAEIAWQANKPLIVYKIATGASGAAAALSHTGSLSGSNTAYRSAFERYGAIVVDDFEALVETARFFAKAPSPSAPGVAVIAGSGGASVIAADKADLHGVALPQPSEPVAKILRSLIPEFGSAHNPCDVTAQTVNDPGSFAACIDAMLSDPVYGALMIPHVFASVTNSTVEARAGALSDAARRSGKMACLVWLSLWSDGPGSRSIELDSRVAVFRSTSRCFAALAAWNRRAAQRIAMAREPAQTTTRIDAASVGRAAALLRQSSNNVLTERASKAVLACYGIPVVTEVLVQNVSEALAHAAQIGYPLVIKVESPDLPHKTEAGVIRLDIRDAAALTSAYEQVMRNAGKIMPRPRINGVLMQPMIEAGIEVMVGARVDPQFGPLVVVGLGGIFVELLKDSALAIAPVSRSEAQAMLKSLKGDALLNGFRGAPGVNRELLADVICRVSQFALDHQDQISEIDVNPFLCSAERVIAVDALIVRSATRAA